MTIGDSATAEAHLRKAVKSSGTKEEASRMLSILLTDQGNQLAASDPRQAENRYDEALDLDATNEEARLGLAR
ncbi:MAG: hypothetical protein KC431_00315, partial [Myxococcales bacterium]|nr:hypothetical protein [Myxococcales bacterium]